MVYFRRSTWFGKPVLEPWNIHVRRHRQKEGKRKKGHIPKTWLGTGMEDSKKPHAFNVIDESWGRTKSMPLQGILQPRAPVQPARQPEGPEKNQGWRKRRFKIQIDKNNYTQKRSTRLLLTPILHLHVRSNPENPKSAACQARLGRLLSPPTTLPCNNVENANPPFRLLKKAKMHRCPNCSRSTCEIP